MFKNTEIKKLFFLEIFFIIISIIIALFISNRLNNKYRQEIINNNANIVGNILNSHPELEQLIITSLIPNNNQQLGLKTLTKYNLNQPSIYNISLPIKENIIIFTFTILISMLLINLLFIKRIYQKINKIDKYMNNILNGDYSLSIHEYCEGDISNLKNDTYKMTVILKEQSEALKKEKTYLEETLADISHQIKTPLTSMYMINDILTKEKDEKIRKEFLAKNYAQIKRIEWLVISLLKLSQLDSGSITLKKEKAAISSLIEKALEPINIAIELKEINLVLDITNKYIYVDKNWTVEALLNIIKNATEHTKNEIKIQASVNPIYTEIRISDNGPGITKQDQAHIFERFYCGNHNKDSIGIGLSMSKKIIELQQGIEIESKENAGSTFIIKLYK